MVYSAILDGDVRTVFSPAVAEMGKVLENTCRNVNAGLVNELAMLRHKMGIDIWEVMEAARTKPYGFQPFYAAPGRRCIPLDPLLSHAHARFSFRFCPACAILRLWDKALRRRPAGIPADPGGGRGEESLV